MKLPAFLYTKTRNIPTYKLLLAFFFSNVAGSDRQFLNLLCDNADKMKCYVCCQWT